MALCRYNMIGQVSLFSEALVFILLGSKKS